MESNIFFSFKDLVLRWLVLLYVVEFGFVLVVEGRMLYKVLVVMVFDVFLIGEMVIIFILYVCCFLRLNC